MLDSKQIKMGMHKKKVHLVLDRQRMVIQINSKKEAIMAVIRQESIIPNKAWVDNL